MSVLSLRSAIATLLIVGSARVALAQQLWAPFVGLSSTPPAGPLWGGSSLVLEPGARFESRRGSLLARWGTTFEQQTPKFDNADLSGRTVLMQGDRFETGIFAAGQYDRGYLRGGPSSNERLRLQFGSASPTSGLQLGVGADAWRLNTGGAVVPASTASGWIRRFGLSFSAEVNARALGANRRDASDTGIVTFDTTGQPTGRTYSSSASGPTSRMRTFGEGRLRVSGAFKSIGVDGEAGVTYATGGASRGFGSLMLSRWLTSSFAFTGGFVVQPAVPGAAERRGIVLGLRLARSPRMIPRLVNAPKAAIETCSVRYTESGVTVELDAPGANHVELSGDFTKWQPVVLEHRTGDRWAITSAIAPGVHHLVVRVDGGSWMPPPGLPQATDLYEGTVGVLVAPEPVVTHQH
jgi:hypothetical protein